MKIQSNNNALSRTATRSERSKFERISTSARTAWRSGYCRTLLSFILTLNVSASSQADEAVIVASDALLTIAEEVDVSAAAEGRLVELSVREGSLVERGAPLLRVDDRRARLEEQRALVELQQAADEAKSDVRERHAAKASELAHSEHERALAIDAASPSSVSDRELDRLRLSAEVAELEVERAGHERRMAEHEWKLAQHAYRQAEGERADHAAAAPLAGLVIEVHKRPGEWVHRGDPVVTLVRVDRLRAEGFLHVSQAPLDLTGAAAAFETTLDGGQAVRAEGQVVFVSPKADPVSSLARVWIEFEVTDRRLRPGLRGKVTIQPNAIATSEPTEPTQSAALSRD